MKRKLAFLLILLLPFNAFAGLNLNGDADYLVKTSATGAPTTKGTISLWVKQDVIDANNCMVEISDATANNRLVFYTDNQSTGFLYFFCTGGGSGNNVWNRLSPITAGTWNHLLITFDTTTDVYTVYVNGVVSTPSLTNTCGNPTGTNKISVGRFYDDLTYPYDGTLDEVAIWNVVLGAQDIANLALSRKKRMPLQIQPSALKAYYALDEGLDGAAISTGTGFYKDLSGNGNDLTATDANANSVNVAETVLSYD